MRGGRRYAAAVLALAVALTAACTGGEPAAPPDSANGEPTDAVSPSTPPDASGDPSTPLEPTVNLFDWQPADLGASDLLVGETWSLVVNEDRTEAVVSGPDELPVPAGRNRRITDVFLDDTRAVVVAQDRLEERPQTVTVVELASFEVRTVGAPKPGPGGPFAYFDGALAFASYEVGGDYCLATHDLAAGTGELGQCAPRRSGFTNLALTPEGLAMQTFEAAGRGPSCRTLITVDAGGTDPLDGVPECKGWDVLALPGGDAIWSTIPREREIEIGDFFASRGGETVALGSGSTGTLTWCGDSAYFVRDATQDRDKARLLRWTPEGTLEVVYESPGLGNAFLTEPRCAGIVLTVTAFGEGGDERVSATVPG